MEQESKMAEPKLLTPHDLDRFREMSQSAVEAELRERGLIAEEPVDPLRAMADKFAVSQGCCDGGPFSNEVFALLEQAKAIGMELAPRKELTQEMVRKALHATMLECNAIDRYDFDDEAMTHDKRNLECAVNRLHTAIQEALQ